MRHDTFRDKAARTVGRGYFPHQLSWLIDNPLRRLIVPPERFATRLPLNRTNKILEIGPGSGYFSVALAHRLPDGHLALLDLQPEMLTKARSKLRAGVDDQLSYTAGDLSAGLPFRDEWFDLVAMVAVLGEVSHVAVGLESIHRVLSPSGFLAVHEHIKAVSVGDYFLPVV